MTNKIMSKINVNSVSEPYVPDPLAKIPTLTDANLSFNNFTNINYKMPQQNEHRLILQTFCKLYIKNKESEKYGWVNAFIQLTDQGKLLDEVKEMDEEDVISISEKNEDVKRPNNSKKEHKYLLCVYYSVPILKDKTSYVTYYVDATTEIQENLKKIEEDFVFRLFNIKLNEKECKRHGDSCAFEVENFLTIQCINQIFYSRLLFHLKRCGGAVTFGKLKNDVLMSPESPVSIEKQVKTTRRSPFKLLKCPREEESFWKVKKHTEWTSKEVFEWLKHIYFVRGKTFYDVCSTNFSESDFSGNDFKDITSKEVLGDLGVNNFLYQNKLFEEIKQLRSDGGFFNEERYKIFQRWNKRPENDYSCTLSEMKGRFSYTNDMRRLKAKLMSILFNIPYKRNEDLDIFFEKVSDVIAKEENDFIRFSVKILTVVPEQEPHFFEKVGMKLVSKRVDTFFHLGLLIKNMQLDWYTNELVHIQRCRSQRPLVCVDVDCFMIEKINIFEWIDGFAKEIMRWNTSMSYTSFALIQKSDGKKANCQDFVYRMLKFFNKNFMFPKKLLEYFNRLKKQKRVTEAKKEFVMSKKFMKKFKIESGMVLDDKSVLEFGEDNVITFESHKVLDLFFMHCCEVGAYAWVDFYGEYELLKSFDRSFHISLFYVQKKKSKTSHAVLYAPYTKDDKIACPFNNKEFSKDKLTVNEEDIEEVEEDGEIVITEEGKKGSQTTSSKKNNNNNSKKTCSIL